MLACQKITSYDKGGKEFRRIRYGDEDWVSDDEPLVSPGSKYGALVSKKCDQETGEDQKGE